MPRLSNYIGWNLWFPMTATYHIVTFGCQMNTYDSEIMAGVMAARGWRRVDSELHADVVLYNTCVVRDHAEQRAMSRLAQLCARKHEYPGRIIGVCGCMAQKEAQALFEALPKLDLIIGTRAIAGLNTLLDRVIDTGQPQVCVDMLEAPYPQVMPSREHPFKAFVNIIYGCNKRCSYCIVPYLRGREQSRRVDEILGECGELIQRGYREITLVGQNVNAYHADGIGFAQLLDKVSELAGDQCWIRCITMHPRDCDEAHLDVVARRPNVCEHFHLPVQSGSSQVLKKMRRGYDREQYFDLMNSIRERIPNATLTTDVIVGFPGETDADYEATLELMRQVRFDAAFTYLYSSRPLTPAANSTESKVPLPVGKTRLALLIALQESIGLEKNKDRIGQVEEVLVESEAPKTKGDLLTRTRGDIMLVAPIPSNTDPKSLIGTFSKVRITGANSHTLFGEFESVSEVS